MKKISSFLPVKGEAGLRKLKEGRPKNGHWYTVRRELEKKKVSGENVYRRAA